MSCSKCGNSWTYSVHSCPNCNSRGAAAYTVEQAEREREAGYKFGYGVVTGIIWLLSNRYLSYFWFWLVWAVATFSIGQRLGYVSDDWMVRPFFFDVIGAIAPVVVAIVFRKHIPRIMSWVWRGLIVALIGLMVLKFVGSDEPSPDPGLRATTAAPAGTSPAARAEAARKALQDAATPEITFTAPGADDTPNIVFEGISMRLCEIDDPNMEACQRYCATLEINDRPAWCK